VPRIAAGACWVVRAFDIGYQIDLARCERLCDEPATRPQLTRRHRSPDEFGYTPAPIRIAHGRQPVTVGQLVSDGHVSVTIYDFAGISVVHRFDLQGRTLEELVTFSADLDDDDRLGQDARRVAVELFERIAAAIDRPDLAGISEDYVLWELCGFEDGAEPAASLSRWPELYAKIIRAEPEDLSDEEVGAAISQRLSYGRCDVTVVDWNGAVLLGPEDPDVRAVLEFANVELMEMRLLDVRLDHGMEEAAAILGKGRPTKTALQRVAHLQLDSVFLFEAVNSALKLIGVQYLAKVYHLASQSFQLESRDDTILRKIRVLNDTYSKLENRASAVRMEVLEVAIALLIVFEIVFSVFVFFAT